MQLSVVADFVDFVVVVDSSSIRNSTPTNDPFISDSVVYSDSVVVSNSDSVFVGIPQSLVVVFVICCCCWTLLV